MFKPLHNYVLLERIEEENEQKQVIAFSGLMFLAGFIIAGLNYRFSWIVLPNIVIIVALNYGLLASFIKLKRNEKVNYLHFIYFAATYTASTFVELVYTQNHPAPSYL